MSILLYYWPAQLTRDIPTHLYCVPGNMPIYNLIRALEFISTLLFILFMDIWVVRQYYLTQWGNNRKRRKNITGTARGKAH